MLSIITVGPKEYANAYIPNAAAVPWVVVAQLTRAIATKTPIPQNATMVLLARSMKIRGILQDLLRETRLPNRSMKMPTNGTTKNPAYCSTEEYQPAVMLSVLNLCSASSVAFCVKMTAVLVWLWALLVAC